MPDALNGAEAPPPVVPTPRPPAPLTSALAGGRPRSWLRALLVSLLVLLSGAAFGAAGFVFEQTRATWRPQVARAGSGWRISTSHGLRLGGSAIGGDHLAWEAGAFTILTDLRSGRSKLLGAGASAGNASTPSLSDRFVAWLQAPATDGREAIVWVYDIDRKRRTRLGGVAGIEQSPAVSGTAAVWKGDIAEGGAQQVRGVDLVTARRFSPGQSPGADRTVVISGTLVAWVSWRPDLADPPVMTVVDMQDDRRWNLTPLAGGQSLSGFALAGRSLVWTRTSTEGAGGQILAYDLDTAAVRTLAQGAGLSAPGADGDLVVWAQPADEGGTRIVGLRLRKGDPFTIAGVSGGSVRSVLASGDTVAWHVAGTLLFDTYLQTTRLP